MLPALSSASALLLASSGRCHAPQEATPPHAELPRGGGGKERRDILLGRRERGTRGGEDREVRRMGERGERIRKGNE